MTCIVSHLEPKGMGLSRLHFLSVFIPGLGNNPRAGVDSVLY